MGLVLLAARNLLRSPLRSGLAVVGIAVAALAAVSARALERGYAQAVTGELAASGVHLFVSAEGCHGSAAAMLLRGGGAPRVIDGSLPERIRAVAGVQRAGASLMVAARPADGGPADVVVGLDADALALKREWPAGARFVADDEAIVGHGLAQRFQLKPGTTATLPFLGTPTRIAAVLPRDLGADDQFCFLPLTTVQRLAGREGFISAVGVQLTDPTSIETTRSALQRLADVAVVPAEAMSQELLGSVRTAQAILEAMVVVLLGLAALLLLNTLGMAVLERRREFALLRCAGARRGQVAILVAGETALLAAAGLVVGLGGAWLSASGLESWVRQQLVFAPSGSLLAHDSQGVLLAVGGVAAIALTAVAWPLWRAVAVPPAEAMRQS